MPNVRMGRKRPRTNCPECGRDVAYTVPFVPLEDQSIRARELRKRKVFARHKDDAGNECLGSRGLR